MAKSSGQSMPVPMVGDFRSAMQALLLGRDLPLQVAEEVFGQVMDGHVSDIRLAALLTALHAKGESADELRGAVSAIRARMVGVDGLPSGAMDVCGTGGDGLGTFNVSTAVAFVLAALGVPVVKHGNRALSSRSGATDVLRELGVGLPDGHDDIRALVHACRVAFLAAPNHHPALRHVGQVRRELGFRTIFNLVGPLCNPGHVRRQLVGVFDPSWRRPIVQTLRDEGSLCVWSVSGACGDGRWVDELTLAGENRVCALDDGIIRELSITATDAGLPPTPIEAIAGGTPDHNARALEGLLRSGRGAYRDTVLLNAAVALHVSGHGNIIQGDGLAIVALRKNVALAASVLDNGAAHAVLQSVREYRADRPE